MGNGDQAWLGWVFEVVVTALDPDQIPTICFDLGDELPAVHIAFNSLSWW